MQGASFSEIAEEEKKRKESGKREGRGKRPFSSYLYRW